MESESRGSEDCLDLKMLCDVDTLAYMNQIQASVKMMCMNIPCIQ